MISSEGVEDKNTVRIFAPPNVLHGLRQLPLPVLTVSAQARRRKSGTVRWYNNSGLTARVFGANTVSSFPRLDRYAMTAVCPC